MQLHWSLASSLILFSLPFFLLAEEEISSPLLKGIVLLGEETDLIQSPENLEGLFILGLQIPGKAYDFQKKVFEGHRGKILDVSTVQEVEQTIYQYYMEKGKPFITISTPTQLIDQGIAQFVIQESKLEEVDVTGNNWTSRDRVINALDLHLQEPIDEGQIIRGLNFLNRNPFRRVDVIYEPGKGKNTTDIDVVVEERRPYRFYVGVENLGLRFTHRERIFAGFNWGNVFGLDHSLSGQYTASYNPKVFQAGTLQYVAPLSWKHLLSIYGGYSRVHATLPLPNRLNHGESYQASLRYIVPFGEKEKQEQEFTFGFDFKATNNNVTFVEFFPVFSSLVNLSQLVVGYEVNFYQSFVNTSLKAMAYYSPGDILPHETNADYDSLRPGAKNQWIYGTLLFKQVYQLPKSFSFFFSALGQLSSETLLPSEQLGIGGYNTVRGYDEREYNVDSGLILNLEARTPPISFITNIRHAKMNDALQFLWFLDFGYGNDYTQIPGIPSKDYLAGTGPGFRYTLDPYITTRLDWGFKLHNQAFFTGGETMLHFSFIASY